MITENKLIEIIKFISSIDHEKEDGYHNYFNHGYVKRYNNFGICKKRPHNSNYEDIISVNSENFNISFFLKENVYDVKIHGINDPNFYLHLQIDSDLSHYQDKLSFVLEHCKLDYYYDDIDSLYEIMKEYF